MLIQDAIFPDLDAVKAEKPEAVKVEENEKQTELKDFIKTDAEPPRNKGGRPKKN